MRKLFFNTLFYLGLVNYSHAQTTAPKPFGAVPTINQVKWQEMEYYAFIHSSTNTFTGQEWGTGAPEDLQLFYPTNFDCDQWARVCKQAGMKGIIVTAKHHSGFCLWPTETTDYSVSQDNIQWKLVNEGEFSNIKNYLLWQIKKFDPVKARYIKLSALKNTQNNNSVGYAEVDVITN